MAERDDEKVLEDLAGLMFDSEELDLPDEIAARVRRADAVLKEETSLMKPLRDGVKSLKDSLAGGMPAVPSFAIEGDTDDDETEDPIAQMLGDSD